MMKNHKRLLAALLAFSMPLSAVSAFSDTGSHWAESYISQMTTAGYLQGYPDGSFLPDKDISISEFSKLAVSVFELPELSGGSQYYSDVPASSWYEPYTLSALFLLPQNSGKQFYGDSPIRRIDVAAAMLKIYGCDTEGYSPNSAAAMADYADYRENTEVCAIISAVLDCNIMQGRDNGFAPFECLTRAELCTLIMRCIANNGMPDQSYLEGLRNQILSFIMGENQNGNTGNQTDTNPEINDENKDESGNQPYEEQTLEQQVLTLVNEYRKAEGLSPLAWDTSLYEVARAHSEDMAARGFFGHENPGGQSPFDRMRAYGISYRTAGENIAAGQKTAEVVMDSWMNSPGHRANILNSSFTKLGVGIAYGGSYGFYWTQCFSG